MKSKYAVVTYWIVIFLIEVYQVVQFLLILTKTPLQLLAKIKKILQEGICRKVPATLIHPPGIYILGNNL